MKNLSLRLDLVSNTMLPVNQLIRIVKTKDGNVLIDQSKKLNGRGVYVAPNVEGIKQVWKKRLIQRSLKTNVDNSLLDQLILEVETNWD